LHMRPFKKKEVESRNFKKNREKKKFRYEGGGGERYYREENDLKSSIRLSDLQKREKNRKVLSQKKGGGRLGAVK